MTSRYSKVAHDDGWATQLWFIVVADDDEPPTQIVCERMYDWAADWLLDILKGHDFGREPKPTEPIGAVDLLGRLEESLAHAKALAARPRCQTCQLPEDVDVHRDPKAKGIHPFIAPGR